jgi:hypothetical protein
MEAGIAKGDGAVFDTRLAVERMLATKASGETG